MDVPMFDLTVVLGFIMQRKQDRVAAATFTSIAVIVLGLLTIGMTSRVAESAMGWNPLALTAGYAERDSR
jgi:NADH:ubiquinone oxidoreductase subunit 3 (subunit A)